MTEQWQELKETITEMRDNGGTGTQQDVCKFLANYMEVLEKQMQQPSEEDFIRHKKEVLERIDRREREIDKYIKELEELEQQPCEDTEVIKVSKGAVKARQGRFVIYDVDWLKENFYTTEEKIYGQPKQPSEDCINCISRESIKQKLQEHRNFYVNAYGGFSNLSQNDKSRVDEIDNCIAMVVNEPSVTPQRPKGKWIKIQSGDKDFPESIVCSRCKNENSHLDFDEHSEPIGKIFVTSKYCPNCGAEMSGGGEDGEDSACG